MLIPNFLSDEFVDQNIFNTAMAQLVTSMRETGSNDIFLLPGVINPQVLLFTTNSTLLVSVTTPNTGITAFKCLFQTGTVTAGFGTTNGSTTSTYNVDFTSLIPIVGSVTAYIVTQAAQIQESSTTIIGPPPGHPDYSATFVPYIGYTQLQDTLNIFATTTVPDNELIIELARVTLVAGQTKINSVDTSHQVLARVNASTVVLTGDVIGNSNSNIISNLQGRPVSVPNPSVNNVLQWNGSAWVSGALATSLPPSGPATNDLTGTYPGPQVLRSSVATFTANAIAAAGAIVATGNISAGGNVAATGNLIGSAATAANQAIILSQLGSISALAPINPTTAGDIYHQSFKLPVLKGGVLAYIIANFGFYCFYGMTATNVENKPFTVNYATPFTQGALFATACMSTNDYTNTGAGALQSAAVTIETPILNSPVSTLNQTIFYMDMDLVGGSIVHIASASQVGLLGFWWIVLGI